MEGYQFLNGVNGSRAQGLDFHGQMASEELQFLVALDPTGDALPVGEARVRQKFGPPRRTFVDERDRPIAEADLEPAMRDAVERRRCPSCGRALVRRRSRLGHFFGCESYVVGRPPVPTKNCVTKVFAKEHTLPATPASRPFCVCGGSLSVRRAT